MVKIKDAQDLLDIIIKNKEYKKYQLIRYDDCEIEIEYEPKRSSKVGEVICEFEIYKNLIRRCWAKTRWDSYKEIFLWENGYESSRKRTLFRSCVAYWQANRLSKVIFVDSKDMFKLHVKEINDNSDNIHRIKSPGYWREMREKPITTEIPILRKIELMGCYVPKLTNEAIIEKYINPKLELKEGEIAPTEYENVILLCVDNMKFFIDGLSDEDKKLLPLEKLIELVFMHELGHLIFEPIKIDDKKIKEKQANFVASCGENGLYDKEIEIITKYQSKMYKDPLLVTSRYRDVDEFNKELFKIYGW